MNININDSEIIIYSNNSFDVAIIAQLLFWKFKPNSENSYSAPIAPILFLKVINFFEKEGILFELKNEAKKYSEDLELVNLNFNNLKKVASDFKNGKFDRIQFDAFKDFVATHIKRPLKIHQLKAAYHLYLIGNGANFSVPGSGKTSVVLTVYEKLRIENKTNTLFVVGPPSSFGPWKHEFKETLGREPSCIVMAGGNKSARKNHYYDIPNNKAELYLISYQSLLSDQKEVNIFLRQKHVKAFFIVDEAHYMKQLNGNWAQAVLKQAEKTNYRCVLTGTPMPKSYVDIFNLFDFLWPNQYPISSENKTLIKYNEELGKTNEAKKILDTSIGPLFYRVRKTDLKLSPQKFLKPYTIDMAPYERKIYNAIYNRIKNYSKNDFYKNIDFINKIGRGRIMRLRQAVSYPKLLSTAIDNYDEKLLEDLADLKNIIRRYDALEIPNKVIVLLENVKALQNSKQKVVIWTNFIETIKLIERHLKQEGFNCKKIFGETPIEGGMVKHEETREKIRDEFIDPNSGLDVLIANPAACAESISLHKTCHNSIYYDLTYNCAQYLQSLDRIHRVGGSEIIEANYHFLQYRNSIDIDIKKNIDRKTKKMFDIIEEDYAIYSLNMTEADSDAEAYTRLFNKK